MGMPSNNWLKLADLVQEETTLFNLELSIVPTESSPRFEWYFKDTEEMRSHLPPFDWMINHYCRLILRSEISDEAIEAYKKEHLEKYQQQNPSILKFGR